MSQPLSLLRALRSASMPSADETICLSLQCLVEALERELKLRAENDDLKSANALLHGLIENRDADIAQMRAALAELLSGHDNLYVAHFGPTSNPHDDIAAKPARRILEER
jgi:hypothetical protein